MPKGAPRVSRQIRLDPLVEAKVQAVADREDISFSSCANWLLKVAADRELAREFSSSVDKR